MNKKIFEENAEMASLTAEREEALYENRVDEAARLTLQGGYRFLFLAGPSCSGKSTTAGLLTEKLEQAGKKVFIFSTDDFFRDRKYAPLNPDGSPDYEAFEHSDPDGICAALKDMAQGKDTEIPIFDFQTGNRKQETRHISSAQYNLFILEGIHALNGRFVDFLAPLSPPVCFYLEVQNGVETENGKASLEKNEIRFCRRLIRDAKHRNASAEWTFTLWESVMRSEKEILLPFRKNAKRILDTGFSYEIGVERDQAIPLLESVSPVSPHYKKAQELKEKLSCFSSLPRDIVPTHSVLREFID